MLSPKKPNPLIHFNLILILFITISASAKEEPDISLQTFEPFTHSFGKIKLQQPLQTYDRGIFATHFFDFFNQPFVLRRHVLTLGYKQKFDFGEIIPKVNVGQNISAGEFFLSSPGFQFEVDAYPIIDPSSYLYLNAGLSASEIFPSQRYGAEYFRSVFTNWEVSGGFRYLKWNEDIFLLTGSLSRYLSSWWFSFRPFFALSSSTLKDSYHLTIRRYFNPPREYAYLILSYGDSPDQPVYLIENFGNFSSAKIQVGIIKTIYNQVMGKIGVGFQNEEYTKNNIRLRFESVIGLEYRF